jgi:hypothetical protein
MSDLRIRFGGNPETVNALEEFCKIAGVRTYRTTEIGNSIIPDDIKDIARLMTVVVVVAKYDVIPKTIEAFRRTRNPPPTFQYIRNGELLVLKDYSAEDVAKIINDTDYFRFGEPEPEPPEQHGEMGFHTGIKPPEKE